MKLVICLSFCYKCRNYKKLNPDIKSIKIRNSIKGLGDLISIITYYLHIPHCSNCERRRQYLNKILPLKWLIPNKFRHPQDNKEIRSILKSLKIKKFPVVFDIKNKTVEYPV